MAKQLSQLSSMHVAHGCMTSRSGFTQNANAPWLSACKEWIAQARTAQKIIDEKTCKRRIAEINAFELMLSNAGTTIIKFFLHISKEEQLARFKARLDDPLKHWKIGEADFDQRERWDDNMAAYEDAIAATSTVHAPWYIIPANRKWYRDLAISEIMAATLEKLAIPEPEPQADIDKLRKRCRIEEAAGVAALKAKK